MNGKMVVSKPLYVALAQRKEDRRARLQVCFLDDFFEPSNNCSGTGVLCLLKSNQQITMIFCSQAVSISIVSSFIFFP